MASNAKFSSRGSLDALGKRAGRDAEAPSSGRRHPGTRRETTARKFRKRGRGGSGGARPLLRFAVRAITDPRALLVLVLSFVAAPAIYFFGRNAGRREASRRLADPQRFAVDVDEDARGRQPQVIPPSPELPAEVFREVPDEECLPSPLWEKRVDPSEYEFGCEEIEDMLAGDKQLIGNGNIRNVYLVELEGGRKVVLKALREDFEKRASKMRADKIHRWEAAALDAVRGHPNIVGMLGVCESSSVSEYFPNRLDALVLGGDAKPLPIASVVSLALDAARGLQALHGAPGGPIVHFDIKPQQMMLDHDGRVKINDLNMCSFPGADKDGNSCSYESRPCNSGPFRSPENIHGERLTEKLDIYSLAMTYYTMLSLKPPYTGEPSAKDRILSGIPPSVDPSWHPGFIEILQDMWQRDPRKRPSAKRVVQRLEILLDKINGGTSKVS